jgi:hypothetical protein
LITPPEINLAGRLIKRSKLKPPIDVFEVARTFSNVEQLELPVDVDGVCLNLKQSGKTPLIIVNVTGRSQERIRFTLAHELGHVLIPWHTGSIVDEIDITRDHATQEYWQLEGEANRFASELLMPTAWVERQIEEWPLPLEATARVANKAEVSFQAATIKVLNCLGAGYIFAQVQNGVVVSSGRSRGTLANQPDIGRTIEPGALFPWTPHRWGQQVGTSQYCWWQFKGDVGLPAANSNQDWRALLDSIIDDIKISADNIPKFKMKVNGIIAYANGNTKENRTRSRVLEASLQRLHSNAPNDRFIRRMLDHPLFREFLDARVCGLLG